MTMMISLSQNKVALIDDEDYERVANRSWRAQHGPTQSTWYAVESGNPWLSMHQFIIRCPIDKMIDHIDHDGFNNQKLNLRVTTASGNSHNRRGVKGYYWETAREKWYASIMLDGQKIFLGRFDLESEADAAYKAAKIVVLEKLFGFGGDGEEDDIDEV